MASSYAGLASTGIAACWIMIHHAGGRVGEAVADAGDGRRGVVSERRASGGWTLRTRPLPRVVIAAGSTR